jgi:hypothetical protein
MPHLRNRERIARAAAELARERLENSDFQTPAGVYPSLQRFQALSDSGAIVKLCGCGCGRPVPRGHRKWFADACRSRQRRAALER